MPQVNCGCDQGGDGQNGMAGGGAEVGGGGGPATQVVAKTS